MDVERGWVLFGNVRFEIKAEFKMTWRNFAGESRVGLCHDATVSTLGSDLKGHRRVWCVCQVSHSWDRLRRGNETGCELYSGR